MEYNLQKTLNAQSNSFSLHLTGFPSNDLVTPGFGQLVNHFSMYVPLNASPSIHTVVKEKEEILQEGRGADSAKNDEKKILDELNSKKRKLLEDPIYESFIHPKVIKTESIRIEKKVNYLHIRQDSFRQI